MLESNEINIGVLGAGGVGSSVLEHFHNQGPQLSYSAQTSLKISRVLVRDLSKPRSTVLPPDLLTTDLNAVVSDPNIHLIISLMGDEDTERQAIIRSMLSGKHVVTANKVVIAKHGPQLFEIARHQNVGLFFEAAVGGGIQVVDNLINRYTPNRFQSVQGILNGTTNSILTRMSLDRMNYPDALRLAQQEGLAEPDPTNDVEGHDAAYKLAILASLAFRRGWIDPQHIHREGISQISPIDFKNAEDNGCVIKLIGSATETEAGIDAWVAPALLPKTHLLANVNGPLNGILFRGDPIGDVQLAGPGAGGNPTAASIWSDILNATEWIKLGNAPQIKFPFHPTNILPFAESRHSNYIRMTITDGLRRVQSIGQICSDNSVSINQILQLKDRKWVQDGVDMAEMALDIDPSGEGNISEAIAALSAAEFCVNIGSILKVLT